jgi:hypothetical protein
VFAALAASLVLPTWRTALAARLVLAALAAGLVLPTLLCAARLPLLVVLFFF